MRSRVWWRNRTFDSSLLVSTFFSLPATCDMLSISPPPCQLHRLIFVVCCRLCRRRCCWCCCSLSALADREVCSRLGLTSLSFLWQRERVHLADMVGDVEDDDGSEEEEERSDSVTAEAPGGWTRSWSKWRRLDSASKASESQPEGTPTYVPGAKCRRSPLHPCPHRFVTRQRKGERLGRPAGRQAGRQEIIYLLQTDPFAIGGLSFVGCCGCCFSFKSCTLRLLDAFNGSVSLVFFCTHPSFLPSFLFLFPLSVDVCTHTHTHVCFFACAW